MHTVMKLLEMDFFANRVKDLVSRLQLSGSNVHLIYLSFAPSCCSFSSLYSVSLCFIPSNSLFITFFRHTKIYEGIIKSLSHREVISSLLLFKRSIPPALSPFILSACTAAGLTPLPSYSLYTDCSGSTTE